MDGGVSVESLKASCCGHSIVLAKKEQRRKENVFCFSEAGPVIQYKMTLVITFCLFFVFEKCDYGTYMWNMRMLCDARNFKKGQFSIEFQLS